MSGKNPWALWLGPLMGAVAAWVALAGGNSMDMATVIFVAVLCVFWWVLEPVPIPVTSLLPIAIFPLFGVLTPAEVGQAYGSPLILLLLGGFGADLRCRGWTELDPDRGAGHGHGRAGKHHRPDRRDSNGHACHHIPGAQL